MSLDVHLTNNGGLSDGAPGGSGIFIREDGAIKQITREEWDARYPGREPVVATAGEALGEVYSRNITHNLNKMADAAGLYQAMWRPDELGATKAHQIAGLLRAGLAELKADPAKFKLLNPSNGWGDYEGLVDFVEEYLAACEKHPDADISVSR